jgi:gliding motility-associated-like protein
MTLLKQSLNVILCLFCFIASAQQISIDNSFNEQELIENNLIQGCVETSNIQSQFNGEVNGFNSFGYFERAGSSFPFENGIMLSTGNAISGGNTLNNDILNEGQPDWATDPDLESALGITGTLNATSIEFDFISVTNQIQFNYILASEEYFGDFPCNYSDGFAFLIKQTGTTDPYVNIAVIPGTSTPVNTNTIHDEIVGFCSAANEEFFEGYNLGDTNYNGRTTVMTAMANIQPNVQYSIKLVIADQTDKNYDSAVFIEGNSFIASVDLGDDIQTCASTVTLDGNIDNPDATYTWFLDSNVISGETQSTLDVTQTGVYNVLVEIPLAGSTCVIEDTISVTLSSTQTADDILDYELCDDASGDEIETFDLSSKDAEVLAAVPSSSYIISYHLTSDDAQNGVSAISGSFQNTTNPQTVFIKIEDTVNGCLAFQSFDLIVNPLPVVTVPTQLIACADVTAGGAALIDLSEKDDEITNGNLDLLVTYHLIEADAINGINAIALPYANTSTNETIFVNVTNSITGCSTTTTLDIDVQNKPIINQEEHYIDACDTDHDDFATFDLTSIIDDVLEGLTGVTVTFHETQEDADLGINSIADDSNYTNIDSNVQTLFIRVEDNTTGCASTTPIEIHTNLLLTATYIRNVGLCDEDNDGEESFDFNSITETILGDLEDVMDYDITIDYYLTEDDRDNQTNPIDISLLFVPTENPQTIYISITSPTCQEDSEFDLIINPITEFLPIGNQIICDEDQDGITTIDLSEFNILVTSGQPDFTVQYFASQEDAENNENELPTIYTNTLSIETIFTRITFGPTACSDINDFDIEILPAPLSNEPLDIIICDDDQDGVFNINLDDKVLELVDDTTNRVISFHFNQSDADSSTNSITDTANYAATTQFIFARIENSITGCHSTESFQVIINTLPDFTAISNYKICENTSDNVGDFIFSTKDIEILNGQTGKEVLYFLNQTDADNNVNVIDKTVAFQNSSNPQIIVARVQNTTDEDCYGTASFNIEVGTNPVFNQPTDWFVCDDITNDGSELFDLNVKIDEVSQGVTETIDVTFYTTLSDAENLTNAISINHANTVNPQTIFVVIDNGTICNSITSFQLNVIQVPEANLALPIITCDENYDGIVEFDLTQSEFEILDVRQDNITVDYFETMDDLEADTNAIPNPSSYNNITNPQTVFIKINNTISNCYAVVPLELIVDLPPAINPISSYDICDTETDMADLTQIDPILLDETENVIVAYFSSEEDARNQENALNTNYTYLTNNDLIFARVAFSTTQCFIIHSFNLVINPLPIANQPENLEACDDDFDGFLEFDLLQQNAEILGSQDPNDFTVSYHLDQLLAEEGIDAIEGFYEAMTNDTIYARVINNTTGCYSTTSFMIVIFERPIVDVGDQVICLENLPLLVSANTNTAGDTYSWSTSDTTSEIEITEVGTYSVTVTTANGCETTEVFSVTESEAATIEITETVDFSDPNNITVTISGIGNYLYQLDNDPPQASNVFENVSLGYHTITIIDLNGCSEVSKEIVVIDAPKFFTPNNDSYFDTWHITGVETLTGTMVYIYDRYGKLLTTLDSQSRGWDGYYNGNLMRANDYWFVADIKKGSIEFQVKGHFSLRL